WDASWTIKEPATGTDMTWLGATNAGNDKLPLNGVDWMTALAFCMSLPGPGRLPTEAEWEAAASMRVGAIYPWAAANTRDG
ncbi:SUMF1/EgtB/PvdO family nonheme iron enzyme, partial [Listeria monocytogenes]|uniref:SUMF1/EgtB/PvdO family nonheme iron enzyme n=1 Tax=Listeria monocytogenes TaxID=1639 RepID=UPI003FA4393A